MTTLAHSVSDSRIMVRRNVRRLIKFPVLTVMLVGIPVVFLLTGCAIVFGALGVMFGVISSAFASSYSACVIAPSSSIRPST